MISNIFGNLGKTIGNALGGIGQVLGNTIRQSREMEQSMVAVKGFGKLANQTASMATAMKQVGIATKTLRGSIKFFFPATYKGKKQSFFKSNPVTWGCAYNMRSRKMTTDGWDFMEAYTRNAATHTSSGPSHVSSSMTRTGTYSTTSTL